MKRGLATENTEKKGEICSWNQLSLQVAAVLQNGYEPFPFFSVFSVFSVAKFLFKNRSAGETFRLTPQAGDAGRESGP